MAKKHYRVLLSAYACHPPTAAGFSSEEKVLGSGESLLGWNLVAEISRHHSAWVLTQKRNRLGIERAVKQGEMKGVRFVFLDFPLWPRALWGNQLALHFYFYFWQLLAFFHARRLHGRIGFDVAHHITFANYWMPSFIGAFLNVPFVWGPLGGGQQIPKSFLSRFPRSEKMAERIRLSAQWIGRNLLLSRKLCMKRAKAILVCNQETKTMIPGKYHDKVFLFPVNGITREDLAIGESRPKRSADFRVISAGRLLRLKAFDLAIRSFDQFAGTRPGARLEIIGEGPEGPNLKRLSEDLATRKQIRFLGWLPRNELLQRLRESDVFLFPSLRDGGGAVVIEAMISSIPVIGLATGGPGFHIQGGSGIKIEPRDPDYVVAEMAKALERLCDHRDLRMKLGKAGRRRAESVYLWSRLGLVIREMYQSAVQGKP